MKKIEVTENYLKNILEALEDMKGYLECCGVKNTYQKHIIATKRNLDKVSNLK